MERLLALWVDDMCSRDDSPMTNILCRKKLAHFMMIFWAKDEASLDLVELLLLTIQCKQGLVLERFKNGNHLHSVTHFWGGSVGLPKEAAQAYLPVLKKNYQGLGYTADQVFNFDKMTLLEENAKEDSDIQGGEEKHQVIKPPRIECHCFLVAMQRVI
ncbi:hypothetical protein GWK47_027844 [Chionoecetes opilio]|uniref:Uncharacterized protein n=1 Tax=Chionoecetes opilio TaxID=41210 RepID=A0A8J8WNE0_CHIOP|nr:hypothetical protein GWK47_027844 [Chionoecetes opilio]